MDVQGQIGKVPVVYDVQVDAALNVSASVSYQGPQATDPSASVKVVIPLGVIAAAAVVGKSAILGEAEQLLVGALEAYIAAQPK